MSNSKKNILSECNMHIFETLSMLAGFLLGAKLQIQLEQKSGIKAHTRAAPHSFTI